MIHELDKPLKHIAVGGGNEHVLVNAEAGMLEVYFGAELMGDRVGIMQAGSRVIASN